MQIAAWHAVLEAVRSEKTGSFNNKLFTDALQAVLVGRGTLGAAGHNEGQHVVLDVLLEKQLQFADIRYCSEHLYASS